MTAILRLGWYGASAGLVTGLAALLDQPMTPAAALLDQPMTPAAPLRDRPVPVGAAVDQPTRTTV